MEPGDGPDDPTDPTEDVDDDTEELVLVEEAVLGAVRIRKPTMDAAVLGAKRGVDYGVLGRRRRPGTGDSIAILLWIIALSISMGTAITAGLFLQKEKKKK